MDTKSLLFFLIIAYLLFCNFQCEDRDFGPYVRVYSKIEFSAAQKNYNLEDTLWLSTTIARGTFESERFPFSLKVKGAPVKFEVIQADENSTAVSHDENSSDIQFEFGCLSSIEDYKFKFGIIFQKKGLYSLQMLEHQSTYLEGNISCDSLDINYATYDWIDYSFDVADANLDLYYNTSITNQGLLLNNGEEMLHMKKAFLLKVE